MGDKKETRENWIHEFENLYILSYKTLYRHGKLLFNQEDKIKELMILTYMEAYQRREQISKEKDPITWLLKRSDFMAETRLEATKEMLEASYAEERMQSKEAKKENLSKLDETSVLLEIEERLGIEEESDQTETKGVIHTTLKGLFSIILMAAAVFVLVMGGMKVRDRLTEINRPAVEPLSEVTGNGSMEEDHAAENFESEEQKKEKICIQVGNKAVFLSDIGQVLYSIPLEESNLTYEKGENPEIQKQSGWTYYLPCPERSDTQLSAVSPSLYHTLYRMNGDGKEIEIVARDVENYTFWNDELYVSQFDRIQKIDLNDIFEKETPGIYAAVRDNEIYLQDDLGRTLKTNSDGSLVYEDRVFKMSSNRILDVRPVSRTYGNYTYYLKAQEDGTSALFRSQNGREELFEANGKTIDSFCIVGDKIYYSAAVKKRDTGIHCSQLYRKSLVLEEEAEELGGEFEGRMYELYYSDHQHQIYGEYLPRSWENYHGIIAAIWTDGRISYIDDQNLRAGTETTGNDRLRFVMVQDGDIYCYWEDCRWDENGRPDMIWRKTLVMPDSNRVLLEN